MPIRAKNRTPDSITLNAVHIAAAYGPITVAANNALLSAVPDQFFVLPQESKVLRVAATANAVSGSPTLQVYVGHGFATSAPAGTDQIAALGASLFNAPITLTCNNYVGQTMEPANIDAVYPSGTVLALGVKTGAADDVTGLRVNLELVSQDEHPTQPLLHAFTGQDF